MEEKKPRNEVKSLREWIATLCVKDQTVPADCIAGVYDTRTMLTQNIIHLLGDEDIPNQFPGEARPYIELIQEGAKALEMSPNGGTPADMFNMTLGIVNYVRRRIDRLNR